MAPLRVSAAGLPPLRNHAPPPTSIWRVKAKRRMEISRGSWWLCKRRRRLWSSQVPASPYPQGVGFLLTKTTPSPCANADCSSRLPIVDWIVCDSPWAAQAQGVRKTSVRCLSIQARFVNRIVSYHGSRAGSNDLRCEADTVSPHVGVHRLRGQTYAHV